MKERINLHQENVALKLITIQMYWIALNVIG